MTLFETVKHSVTVKQAAEHYGFEVNRGDMICCPFHDDRHPSMKLNRDYFYCFGCGATGDVIDFVARLFGLSSYEAAKKLAYDFGIDPDKPPAAVALKKPYPLARAFRNDEMYCQRCCATTCICWNAGRSSTPRDRRRMNWMTALWKPVI